MAEIKVVTLRNWLITWFRGRGISLATSMRNIKKELAERGMEKRPTYAIVLGHILPVRSDWRVELVRKKKGKIQKTGQETSSFSLRYWQRNGITTEAVDKKSARVDITFVYVPESFEKIDVDAETGYDIWYDNDTTDYVGTKTENSVIEEVTRSDNIEVIYTNSIETPEGHEPFKAPEVDISKIITDTDQKTIKDFIDTMKDKLKEVVKEKFDNTKFEYVKKMLDEKGEKISYKPSQLLSEKITPKSTRSIIKTGVEIKMTNDKPTLYHVHIQVKNRKPIDEDIS